MRFHFAHVRFRIINSEFANLPLNLHKNEEKFAYVRKKMYFCGQILKI